MIIALSEKPQRHLHIQVLSPSPSFPSLRPLLARSPTLHGEQASALQNQDPRSQGKSRGGGLAPGRASPFPPGPLLPPPPAASLGFSPCGGVPGPWACPRCVGTRSPRPFPPFLGPSSSSILVLPLLWEVKSENPRRSPSLRAGKESPTDRRGGLGVAPITDRSRGPRSS